jgi:integrase
MQRGWVERHGNGWRGRWREDGKLRSTRHTRLKGEATQLLEQELDRIRLGGAWISPITFDELCDRFLAQYNPGNPRTVDFARARLARARATFGTAHAADLTTETWQRWLVTLPVGKAFRHDIRRTLRMVYRFAVDARLVRHNPATGMRTPGQVRSSGSCRSSLGGGRPGRRRVWQLGAARPVHGRQRRAPGRGRQPRVAPRRPGRWRRRAARHEDERRVADRPSHRARRRGDHSMPRVLGLRRVFHVDGRPISFTYFRREIWHPALELAGLDDRSPYNLRHTFAYWSLRAGVPIATVAREMGHTTTEMTFKIYGGWHREIGQDAAAMRQAWAAAAEREEQAR